MSDDQQYVVLPGSERAPVPGATRVADAPSEEPVEVTVVVRRKGDADAAGAVAALAEVPSSEREALSPAELEDRYGAAQDDLKKVEAFAVANGLEVVDADAARRRVALRGKADQMGAAFDVSLGQYEAGDVSYRGREGEIRIPAALDGVVTAVLGLDDRPQARPRLRRAAEGLVPAAAHSFPIPAIAELYDWPSGTAAGQWIAIIELGGGFRQADLDAYFQGIGRATPTVVAVDVDGATNAPGADADGEVMLDIEVCGAVAPGADIAVYFAPNTTRGFTDAITAAAHDAQRRPGVISISWGLREQGWTAQAMQAMDDACADAALLGVTVTAAAGDDGAQDGSTDGSAQCDFPSSSPHVLACGGTRLEGGGSTITSETVWNNGDGSATGGGVSAVFPLPAWQAQANVPVSINPAGQAGRGVPDVAGVGDPNTGYQIRVDGQNVTIGGTSAVAPLWAGLIALLNARTGRRLGFLNPDLYTWALGGRAFRDVTQGNNIVPGSPGYSAQVGWDACTGLGSPRGNAILQILQPPFLLQTGTPITAADAAANFAFATGPVDGDAPADLVGLKRSSTGTGSLEVHVLSGASNYQDFAVQTGTPVAEADASANFEFAVGDFNRDGSADVYCLKRSATGTGMLEVHVLSGRDGYQSFLLQTGTPIAQADASANFAFGLGDFDGDGFTDLYCLKRSSTGTGRLEVHVLSGKDNYQSFLLQTGTPITVADAAANFAFAVGDYDGDGRADVLALKRTNTGTGSLEVHVLGAASGFQTFALQTGTPITEADAAANFVFATGGYASAARADLYCLKRTSTGTGRLEVHVLGAAADYQ
ncbi:hypothetical protein DSM104299_00728 [Baekduia alba]|uniref:protease pro-enzyme activation domain-containing protein n=1 Tax=Baekduia alba TaxID=2997333 RepID=UPI00234059CA|nr:protease pro-enzyme activation domain-containing protein [Baekduia alba]WCB92046.1 hypothetical protein DSM104299_00728 [Baekduia alba]